MLWGFCAELNSGKLCGNSKYQSETFYCLRSSFFLNTLAGNFPIFDYYDFYFVRLDPVMHVYRKPVSFYFKALTLNPQILPGLFFWWFGLEYISGVHV
jgi:hypothetical protein